MQIIDQFGRPIQSAELAEPQTAKLGHLRREFADHPSRGLTPARLARILQEAEEGDLQRQSELMEDMEEKDAHIYAELSKRKRALLTLDWDIKPPRNATTAETDLAESLRETILDIPDFEDALLDVLDAIGKGFSAIEITWALNGRDWMPQRLEYRPQAWFVAHRERRNELRLRDHTPEGAELRPFGWVLHTHRAKSGYIARGGLHRQLAWPYLFKNFALRDLAEFLEIYGLPLRLGTYPSGAGDAEKAALLAAVVNVGHAAAGIIPEGMAIDFKDAAKGTEEPFAAMLTWCEAVQSKAILGGTLTTTAAATGLGSNLGDIHNEVRHDLLVSDARQLAATLTRDLLFPLVALNHGGADPRRMPQFRFDTQQPEDLKLYAESVPKLVQSGMRIPARWVHEKLRIPQAQDGEPVLSAPAPAAPPQPPGAALRRVALKASATPPLSGSIVGVQAARLETESGAVLDPLIEAVRAIVDEADSLDAVRERLLALVPDINADRLARLMQEAFAAAALAGRIDTREGFGGR